MNSLGRLHSLTKNLIRSNKLGEYDKIIQEQRNESIIEKLGETKTSFFFFFFYNNDLQLETKNKPKTYNSAPISMLCDVGGKLNVKKTKYNIKIYLS